MSKDATYGERKSKARCSSPRVMGGAGGYDSREETEGVWDSGDETEEAEETDKETEEEG